MTIFELIHMPLIQAEIEHFIHTASLKHTAYKSLILPLPDKIFMQTFFRSLDFCTDSFKENLHIFSFQFLFLKYSCIFEFTVVRVFEKCITFHILRTFCFSTFLAIEKNI